MSKITSIDKNIPHACIIGPLNEPHCIPIEALRRMSVGINPLIHEGQEREDRDLIQGIISDWLHLNGFYEKEGK